MGRVREAHVRKGVDERTEVLSWNRTSSPGVKTRPCLREGLGLLKLHFAAGPRVLFVDLIQ